MHSTQQPVKLLVGRYLNKWTFSQPCNCVSLLYLLLYSLWSLLSKHYDGNSIENFIKSLFRSFCFLSICHAIAENRQKRLYTLFKIDVSLKNLNNEILLDIVLFGSDKYKDNKEIKTTKRFERPLFFTTDTILWLSLRAPYQQLQISMFSPIFKQCFTGFGRE